MRRRAFAVTEAQAADLMRRGYDTIYRASEGESLDDFLQTLRAGGVYGIASLDQLADRKAKHSRLRRRSLFSVLRKVCAIGAILEDSKGRRTDRDKIEMVEEAIEILTDKGRGRHSARNGRKSKGRPPEYTPEEIEKARLVWQSRKYATATEALKHMPGWTRGSAYRILQARD